MKNPILFLFLSIVFFSCKKNEEEKEEPYITTHTENWMQDLMAKYPDSAITLKKICIPRAHDAGMYEVNDCYAGNACNTQTQNRDMTSMLESGIRVFDVRPALDSGVYWTFHKTNCGGFGCNGVELKTLLEQTKTYLDAHSELVILELSHFCNTSPQDGAFLSLLNTTLGNRIYKENPADTIAFINKPLSNILNGEGKVLLLMEGIQVEDKAQGYFSKYFIDKKGSYADEPYFEEMKADQLSKFQAYNTSNTSIFSISWTQTMNNALAIHCLGEEGPYTSIQDLSQDATNALKSTLNEWIEDGIITKTKIPNIISVDFSSTLVTEQCIVISEFSLD